MKHSLIEFKEVKSKTVLTHQYSVKPLKIINPKASPNICYCVLTNYGGGFIQGDGVKLAVYCGTNTNSIISSQANTRVYESNGVPCSQIINTKLEKNAFHVYLNDPLVLHEGGTFFQKSRYKLTTDSVLLLVDWFVAGRTENGEKFAFKEYNSETEVVVKDVTILHEKFQLSPDNMDIYSPSLLSDNISFMNVFLAGGEDLERVALVEYALNAIQKGVKKERSIQSSVSRIHSQAYLGRFASSSVLDLKNVSEKISAILSANQLLQFDPLIRKY